MQPKHIKDASQGHKPKASAEGVGQAHKTKRAMVQEIDVQPLAHYSPTEAAKLLGVSKTTLMRWTKRGDIACKVHKLTGKRFYQGRDILKYWNAVM